MDKLVVEWSDEELRVTFDLFDTNKDGKISKDELSQVLQNLGSQASEEELENMINNADLNQNGFVEFEEFVKLMKNHCPAMSTSQSIVEAFDVFDIDGDKFISREEIRVTMSRLGQNLTSRELDEMVAVKGLFLFINASIVAPLKF
jgi:calmodulin